MLISMFVSSFFSRFISMFDNVRFYAHFVCWFVSAGFCVRFGRRILIGQRDALVFMASNKQRLIRTWKESRNGWMHKITNGEIYPKIRSDVVSMCVYFAIDHTSKKASRFRAHSIEKQTHFKGHTKKRSLRRTVNMALLRLACAFNKGHLISMGNLHLLTYCIPFVLVDSRIWIVHFGTPSRPLTWLLTSLLCVFSVSAVLSVFLFLLYIVWHILCRI